MSDQGDDELDGFGAAARRAIAAAARAAAGLGTTRVGTEHLLLGVLAVGSSAATAVLRDTGVSPAAVRRKVAETHVGTDAPTAAGGAIGRSPRAERALSRAHRFAHERRSPETRSEHLLLGILDVEGTAGQVLRGLDVDVDGLRSRLQQADLALPDDVGADAPMPDPVPATSAPRCPSCSADLPDVGVSSTPLKAGATPVVVIACGACGTAIGAVAG